MDTLCIPVKRGKTIRQKAIAQMDFTYAGADNILVIDPCLQSISEGTISKVDFRLQLACSPWMTRCWTFQKALLARAWQVHLLNSVYKPSHDHRRELNKYFRIHTRSTVWTDERELEREAISFYKILWPLVDKDPNYNPLLLLHHETSEVRDLTRIWRQLAIRSTTRRTDRLIILAISLDLNAGEIMSLNIQEQMKAILRKQMEIPLAFLFESFEGPVVDDPKCQWIPLYPESLIGNAYGCMVRNQAGTHYQFMLSNITAYGYMISAEDSKRVQFRIDHNLEFSSEAWILINPRGRVGMNQFTGRTCVILSPLRKMSSLGHRSGCSAPG